jgi:transcriptional regulator with XRE-family HTH domain
MAHEIAYYVNNMALDNVFGPWFRPILEGTHLRHKAVAERAGIAPGSLSRILNGATGVDISTARRLARALNDMAGRPVADEDQAVRLAAGITSDTTKQMTEAEQLAQKLARDIMASGFNDLEDEALRESFMADMRSLAESMLKRKLEEQEKKRQ